MRRRSNRFGRGVWPPPSSDLWFGGTGDPHLQAAQSKPRAVGIYSVTLDFGYNPERLVVAG